MAMVAEQVYRYSDLEDRTVLEVVRKPGKQFLQRRPADNGEGYVYDAEGVQPVPYRYPWVELAADQGETVWLVEGEKDADRLAALGLCATTTWRGASVVWPVEWAEWFRGAERVFVLPDNDDPGRKAARQRAAVILHAVSEVRIVELPDLPEKGDVSDWLDAGGDLEQLWRIAEAAASLRAVDVLDLDLPAADPSLSALPIRFVSDALDTPPAEPLELVEGFLRAGELTAIVAPRAVGKSFLVFNLACCLAGLRDTFLGKLAVKAKTGTLISQGELDEWGSWSRWRMLCEQDGPPEGVAETFERWRLRIVTRKSAGRDHQRDVNWQQEWHDAELDERLERSIVQYGFGVLVIDPWAVYFAGKENNNDEAEAALSELRALAMRTGVAVVIVHHISKATEAREPEDLWRGASRLADWASTRVTMLPHYKNEREWLHAGHKTRQSARRHLDVHFLRRGTPIDDFSIRWESTGWWQHWQPGEAERLGRPLTFNPDDVALVLAKTGPWLSRRQAGLALGLAKPGDVLRAAVAAKTIEEFRIGKAYGYRLPGDSSRLLDAWTHHDDGSPRHTEVAPSWSADDPGEF